MHRNHVLLLFLLLSAHASAQDFYAQGITMQQGLPANAVYDMLQDSKGFLWFATDDGISRYDGYTCKTYYSAGQTSKPGSELSEDRYGRIWYENFDGFLYYLENDTLKKLPGTRPIGFIHYGLFSNNLLTVEQDSLCVYDLRTLKPVKKSAIPNADSLSYVHKENNRLCVISKQILLYDSAGNRTELQSGISPGMFHSNFIAGNAHELFIISSFRGETEVHRVTGNRTQLLFRCPISKSMQGVFYIDNSFWFCTASGVYVFDKTGAPHNNGKPYFENQNISGVLKDREGNFWISTTTRGLLFVPDIDKKLVYTAFTPYRITRAGDSLYVGSAKGDMYLFDLLHRNTALVQEGHMNKEVNYIFADSLTGRYYYNSGSSMLVIDRHGKLLRNENIAAKGIQRVDEKYLAMAVSGICYLYADNPSLKSEWDNWPATDPAFPNRHEILPLVRGKAVAYVASRKRLYFATNVGVFSVTPEGKNELQLNGSSIYLVALQQCGEQVFGVDGQGMVYTISGETISRVAWNDAFGGQPVRMIKAGGNLLFVRTDGALYFIDTTNPQARPQQFDINTGAIEITDIARWNNTLIFATDKGLLFSDIRKAQSEQASPLFVMNQVLVNNRPVNLHTQQVFAYDNNTVEFNYSILSFKTGSRFPLYYQINNSEWALASPESRTLKLVSLSPGEYRIRFRLGTQELPAQELVFTISKPWWLRPWFLLLCVLLFVAAAYLYFRWRIAIMKKQNKLIREKMELEKNLDKSMLASIKAQMNPHFFYNALNTIQAFIFSDDKKNASSYLAKFSKLTRMILEFSEKEHITLSEEISALKLYLEIEQVRFNDDFEFHFRIGPEVNTETIRIPSMLIQPYVENAVKHGLLHKKEHKVLTLSFSCSGQVLRVVIDDNGIGRKRSEELNRIRKNKHEAFATNANQTRLNILNNDKQQQTAVDYIDKTDNHNNPAGTTVIITVPVK